MIWQVLNTPHERPYFRLFGDDEIKFLKSLIGIKYSYLRTHDSQKVYYIREDFRGFPIVSDETRYYSDDYETILNRFKNKKGIKIFNNRFCKHKEAMCQSQ